MKTEDLVNALVADRADRRPVSRRLIFALAAGGSVSLLLFLAAFGVRPDIDPALATWRFDIKVALVLFALALALRLCLALARPTASAGVARQLAPLAVVVTVLLAVELASVPPTNWGTRLIGSNALICMTLIPVLSLAPLAAVIAALRAGAPASPARAGAAAGLLAAMAGASLYAFHCFDDSPLFVVTWYTLASMPVMLAGALLGHRLLRW